MNKKYKKIEIEVGSTIDEAVEKLQKCNERGEFAYVSFNGIILYSDNVTLDSAYIKVTDMTKARFDELMKVEESKNGKVI